MKKFKDSVIKEELFEKRIDEYIDSIKDKKSIAIFGAGLLGGYFVDLLKKYNMDDRIKCFADNDKIKQGQKKCEIDIISPKELSEIYKEESIHVVVTAQPIEIKNQLCSLGIDKNDIDLKGAHIAHITGSFKNKTPYQVFMENIEKFEQTYNYFDDYSKDIYIRIINTELDLDNSYLYGLHDAAEEQYFDSQLIKLNDKEVFVDGGAYIGDTMSVFMEKVNHKYKKYIAFEAEENNFIKLKNIVKNDNLKNVEIYQKAIWSKKEQLHFSGSATSGKVDETGVTVQADSIDNILDGGGCTFIKMDIEGAEEQALIGAKNTIEKYQPTLAICIYHRFKDFFKLPILIKEFNGEYDLHLRHYGQMLPIDHVCYAIQRK